MEIHDHSKVIIGLIRLAFYSVRLPTFHSMSQILIYYNFTYVKCIQYCQCPNNDIV